MIEPDVERMSESALEILRPSFPSCRSKILDEKPSPRTVPCAYRNFCFISSVYSEPLSIGKLSRRGFGILDVRLRRENGRWSEARISKRSLVGACRPKGFLLKTVNK